MIDVIMKANPALSLGEAMALALKAMQPQNTVEQMIAKEAARVLPAPAQVGQKFVYLKKDKNRKFPINPEVLETSYAVRQTYLKKLEEGDVVKVPARNLNEFALYDKETFDQLSEKGRGFDREGITIEIWHKPGQKNTVQPESASEKPTDDDLDEGDDD